MYIITLITQDDSLILIIKICSCMAKLTTHVQRMMINIFTCTTNIFDHRYKHFKGVLSKKREVLQQNSKTLSSFMYIYVFSSESKGSL